MRIRSIRPEFWSSEDIAALTWEQRLIYIGLWSYVDDNGVGRDNAKLIAADLFPLEERPPLKQVAGALTELSSRGMITRYECDGKAFLHVTAWERHQRINRPSAGRYPHPTREDAVPHASLTEPSLSPHVIATLGEGEKGRRGEGKQTPSSADADALFDRFWDAYPKKVAKQAARRKWDTTIKSVDPETILAGVHRYVDHCRCEGTEVKYIKGPEVWLNKGCWADDLTNGHRVLPVPAYVSPKDPDREDLPWLKGQP